MRIAVAQLRMHWSGDDNAAAVVRGIAAAAQAGATLCVFPELAIPGFHRRIAEFAVPERVQAWLSDVRQACETHAIAAAVGAPTFDVDGRIQNSLVFVDAHGAQAGVVEKRGLTDPEATFFAPGNARPLLALCGRRCSAVLCREVEDFEPVCADFAHASPELLLWPGQMSPEPDDTASPPRYVQQAQRLARQLSAYVVQANWPQSLNYPEKDAQLGASVVLSPQGAVLLRLPQARAGLGVFTLGEAAYDWLDDPLPSAAIEH